MVLKKDSLNKRQEIKFLFNESNFFKLRIDKKINKIFPTRLVNSIYFDTLKFDFFHESEEGLSPRKKIRIRYYDNNDKNLALEIKFTNNYWRSKYVKKFLLDEYSSNFIKKESGNLTVIPRVKISYLRDYYQSTIGRITIDRSIKCERIYSFKNSISKKAIPINNILQHNDIVLELKTGNNFSKYQAIKYFGTNDTRMSKYCEAIKKLYRNN